jgi:hypothetical protein
MRLEGSVGEEQYESLKGEYDEKLSDVITDIDSIKSEIGKELEAAESNLATHKRELSDLEVRHKVGELSDEEYQRSEKKMQNKIEKAQATVSELKNLAESKSSSDIPDSVAEGVTLRDRSKPSDGLTFGEIFTQSFELYKANPIIIIPSLIPVGWEKSLEFQ